MLLMRITHRLKEEGIAEAAVVMGTPINVQILQSLGFPEEELRGAGRDDLVIALAEEDQERVEAALEKVSL
ncbi:MAG: hypothetical protein ACUVQS_05395 [Candidatus Bipolaricaulaceae bacterium]